MSMMLAFQGAMAVTSLFGGRKANKGAKMIAKEQKKTFEINKKAIESSLAFNKTQREHDMKDISEAYAENFVRLNESYVDERAKIKSELDVVADKYKMQIKTTGIENSSYVADVGNRLEEEYQESIRKVNGNLIKQSQELSKEKTQQYINNYQNYLNNMLQASQELSSNMDSYISKSSATLKSGSDAQTNGIMNAFKIGTDMYATAKTEGVLPSWLGGGK